MCLFDRIVFTSSRMLSNGRRNAIVEFHRYPSRYVHLLSRTWKNAECRGQLDDYYISTTNWTFVQLSLFQSERALKHNFSSLQVWNLFESSDYESTKQTGYICFDVDQKRRSFLVLHFESRYSSWKGYAIKYIYCSWGRRHDHDDDHAWGLKSDIADHTELQTIILFPLRSC